MLGRTRRFAIALALAAGASPGLAQEPAGPPPGHAGAPRPDAGPRVVQGVASFKLPGHSDWTSTGLSVRRGEMVRIKAWGRIRVARAAGRLVDPAGIELPGEPTLAADARPGQLIAVVGDNNNDYVAVGRGADFRATHDGVVFVAINQVDATGNTGDFDVRVSVGAASGLAFGGPDLDALAAPPSPAPVAGAAAENEKLVTVMPRLDWTNTYLNVKVGDTVVLEASGSVTLDLAGKTAGPDGIVLKDPGRLIPDRPTGALIAVVGIDNNDFLFVGSKGRFVAARSGLLFLGVNEEDLTNNAGSFNVRVRIERAAK
jgi:hypothetical protein